MTIDGLIHSKNLLSGLCGGGAFVVVLLVWAALIEKDPLPARLKSVTQRRSELREEERQKKMTRRPAVNRMTVMRGVVEKLKLAQGKKIDELRLKLARAGYRARDTMFVFLFLKLALPLGLAFLSFFFIFVLRAGDLAAGIGFVTVCFFALFGLALPNIFIKNLTQKREQVLHKALPDALDLLVICAEAGLSLDASFDRVSREIGSGCPELAEEIGLTSVELNFLPDRSKALQNLSDRVALQGMIALTNTLIQTEKYGTPLAQSLRVLSAEMRDERIMQAEAKAAKLPATLTIPMILFILPPLFIVLIGPAALKVVAIMHGQ